MCHAIHIEYFCIYCVTLVVSCGAGCVFNETAWHVSSVPWNLVLSKHKSWLAWAVVSLPVSLKLFQHECDSWCKHYSCPFIKFPCVSLWRLENYKLFWKKEPFWNWVYGVCDKRERFPVQLVPFFTTRQELSWGIWYENRVLVG